MSDNIFVVCMPTAELAVPSGPASRSYCETCHTEVWIADTTPKFPDMHIVCANCGLIQIHGDDDSTIITRAELLNMLPDADPRR